MFFYKLQNFFYHDRILGQAGRKIRESVGSIYRGRPLVQYSYYETGATEIRKQGMIYPDLWNLLPSYISAGSELGQQEGIRGASYGFIFCPQAFPLCVRVAIENIKGTLSRDLQPDVFVLPLNRMLSQYFH
jgi:hypothetical protein